MRIYFLPENPSIFLFAMSGSQIDPANAAICEPIRQPVQSFPVLRIGFCPCFIARWRFFYRIGKTSLLFPKALYSGRQFGLPRLLTIWCKRTKENLCAFVIGPFRPRFLFCNSLFTSSSPKEKSVFSCQGTWAKLPVERKKGMTTAW